ncbi:hypothetical protein Efla_006487 [Eimeria flavescens]
MSTFGSALRVTTYGESHGPAIGCVIDGLPGGLRVCSSCLQRQLRRRRPGAACAASSSSRSEEDEATIQSGVERGLTLGTPVCLLIRNRDVRREDYSNVGVHAPASAPAGAAAAGGGGSGWLMMQNALEGIPRPGHAELTYLLKYGAVSSSGGGRSSARETAARVAAASLIESSLLSPLGLGRVVAFVAAVGLHSLPDDLLQSFFQEPPSRTEVDREGTVLFLPQQNKMRDARGCMHAGIQPALLPQLQQQQQQQQTGQTDAEEPWPIHTRCPHAETAVQIARTLLEVRAEGDSIGGVVCCVIQGPPAGLGERTGLRQAAREAGACNAVHPGKQRIGSGFKASRMRGSEHNDPIHLKEGEEGKAVFSPVPPLAAREMGACQCEGEQTEEEKDALLHARSLAACAEAASNLRCTTNSAGGSLGGISTGENINVKVAFKPPSSISRPQTTSDFSGTTRKLEIKGKRENV